MKQSKQSFTLIELIVVLAIIVILSGMAVTTAQMARRRAAITKAKTLIASLEMALSMYARDIGDYPREGIANLVKGLSEGEGEPEWIGPYMRFKEDELNDKGELLDPWGTPYNYINPGIHNPGAVDIWSNGQDGEPNTNDDIKNW